MLENRCLSEAAIDASSTCETVFVKYLAANDTGATGGHQSGIYIPQYSYSLLFDEPCERGENKKESIIILRNDSAEVLTNSTALYYGRGTRNEYRITGFGRGFDLLKPEYTGSLLVVCKKRNKEYLGFVLSSDEEIENYLDYFSISPTETNCLIKRREKEPKENEKEIFDRYYIEFGEDFPSTRLMAISAEEADAIINSDPIELDADDLILRWIDTEYRLFTHIENNYYAYVTTEPAKDLDEYIRTGLKITNRRKSRAGKSLEHHLLAIFNNHNIEVSPQANTELNKKPDFIFPSEDAYHDASFPAEHLTFLGAKTTCKDRWRQVINEADRIEEKYLFTLQKGISSNQLKEMHKENVTLVVPKPYHRFYPEDGRENLISLEEFLSIVEEKQKHFVS